MSAEQHVGVVDYGGGNIRSLVKALEAHGIEPVMVTSPAEMQGLDKLFFPGQGAFGDCMARLASLGLVDPLIKWIEADRPFFGICVGYQLLFQTSEESPGTPGLGVMEGRVIRFPESELKVPHMGWNAASLRSPDDPLWQGLGSEPYFYYVHSYFPTPSDSSLIAADTNYGIEFAGAIQRGRLLATQFHPEKSQKMGMRLIGNFLSQP